MMRAETTERQQGPIEDVSVLLISPKFVAMELGGRGNRHEGPWKYTDVQIQISYCTSFSFSNIQNPRSVSLSCYAKPIKKPADRTPLDEDDIFLSPAFSLRTNVELKLSLRKRLARQMHAIRMHSP
jgi:hypothetical protein